MEYRGEKAYCLTKLEFMILLSVAGISGIYCFSLPGESDVSREDILTSLHGLVKRGLAEVDGEIRLSDEIRRYMDIIRRADRVLSAVPREAGPQKICYLSTEAVVVAELGEQENEIRIYCSDKGRLFEILMNDEEMPWSVLPLGQDAVGEEVYLKLAEEEYERMQELEPLPLEEPIFDWFQNEQVMGAWELLDPKGTLVQRRWVFLSGESSSWILTQGPGYCEILLDSACERKKLQNWII